MTTVKINTSDTEWIRRYGIDLPCAIGTDVKGVMYFTTTIEVGTIEHVKFAGADMIRFNLGPDAPSDHNRNAMYPASYLVTEAR